MKTSTIPTQSQSLLPESVRNVIESVNCASRVVLKTCEGVERTVEGVDEIATLALAQQKRRLERELRKFEQEAIPA